MPNLWLQSGTGGAGALFGSLISWLGFRQRLDAQDKRLDTMAENVMYKDTCDAKFAGVLKRMDDQNQILAEVGKDIKNLLRRNG